MWTLPPTVTILVHRFLLKHGLGLSGAHGCAGIFFQNDMVCASLSYGQ